MNVLYQQGLEDVAVQLARMGYQVHPLHSGLPADAVLYTSDAHGALNSTASVRGAAMVCVRGMSTGEIVTALRRRGCAALF